MPRPQEVSTVIIDLLIGMKNISRKENGGRPLYPPEGDDNTASVMEQLYGDTWEYLIGIIRGMEKIEEGYDVDADHAHGHVFYSLKHWKEHYDKFGEGAYGEGLELGRRLFFYENGSDTQNL